MDRNRLVSDTGVAKRVDGVERAHVNALVARRLADVVVFGGPCCGRCRRSSDLSSARQVHCRKRRIEIRYDRSITHAGAQGNHFGRR
jgi:hypothetical protein